MAEKHGTVSFRRLLKTWVSRFHLVVKKHASLSSRRLLKALVRRFKRLNISNKTI